MEDVQEQTSFIYTVLVSVLSAFCIICIMGLVLLVISQIGKEKILDTELMNGKLHDCTDATNFVHCHFLIETETKRQFKRKKKPADREDDILKINYVDLIDLDDNLASDEETVVTELQDDSIVEFSIELPEETEQSFCQIPRIRRCRAGILGNFEMDQNFEYTKDDDWLSEKQRESNTGRNGYKSNAPLLVHVPGQSRQVDVEQEKINEEFYNSYVPGHVYCYNSILESPEVGSSFNLKHESMHDSLHVSNKVTTWNNSPDSIDGDYIDVMVNDIICYYANTTQQPENDPENSKKSKGIEATVCKTTNSHEAAVFLECTEGLEVKKDKPKKRHRQGRRRRNKRRIQRSLRGIINWQTSLRRNPTVLYDVRPGISDGRTTFHEIAHSSSNENCEDSRGIVNGSVAEAQPQIAGQRKPCNEGDHLHANGVQETVKIPLKHQNGIVDYKSTQIVDNKSTQIVDNKSTQIVDNESTPATEEEDRENGASYSSPLQSASASNGFSLMTTETLSSFFDSVSLLSVGEDEAFSYEWIRLRTFSDWPLTSIFSTTLARNGWVSLGEDDKARCYSCHVVHKGWRISDDPNQYHSPNCRFKSGQSNNIPISRGTSNQTPNLGQISRDQQQFPSHGNLLYPEILSGVASSVGPPDPVQGLSDQGLNRPQQDSFLPQESNLQQQETTFRPQEKYRSPLGTFTRPQESNLLPQGNFSRPQETRDTNTAPLTENQNVIPSQQLSAGLPTSEAVAAPTPRNTDSSRHTGTPRNTGTPTPQVPTDNLHSTAAAEAPSPHSKEAQLEALKRDPMGINFDRPKYPSYAILAVRISSYTDWPAAMTQTPRDMALAGFFYAGYGDYTRCFFCGGGLRNWEAGDDPWVEHARWFKKCAFVRQNRGQEFIDLVQKRAAELDEQGNQEEVGNQQTNTAISDPNSAQAKEEKVMKSPAVTTIKEMGYSEDKIKAAIHTIKSRLPRGKHKVSAQEILEVIFELNQSESGTPVGQSERVSENPTNSTNQSDSTAENTAHHMGQSDPAPEGNQNSTNEAASAMEASNADQASLDEHENRNSLPNPYFDELTSLKQENTSLKDQILCKICMEKNVSIAFLPCGHLACCEDCAPAMRKCPICREFVRGTVKTFLV
ncbi:uncharacterized protein LOC128186179 [Crassostrea angulata]|uniref:uncharacterized protein LOC128186179 n=1 Tax=Magallana angulata TaxID=2784310 RepID=UPI0022B1AE32|nr:uncharacterized protein LOC128186179 [Crassostrea angulata]XP_052711901.1 uncharacterized protein LOC128186179 [Crassostrea angulata]